MAWPNGYYFYTASFSKGRTYLLPRSYLDRGVWDVSDGLEPNKFLSTNQVARKFTISIFSSSQIRADVKVKVELGLVKGLRWFENIMSVSYVI